MLSSIICLDPNSRGYFYSWLAFTSAKLQKAFFVLTNNNNNNKTLLANFEYPGRVEAQIFEQQLILSKNLDPMAKSFLVSVLNCLLCEVVI